MSKIINNYQQVKQRIAEAVSRAGHRVEPQLLAVSKKQDVSKIIELARAGHVDFGESYVQEAMDKIAQTDNLSLTWHFIGPIQSNKVKFVAPNFHWVHSVDRMKVLKLLMKHRSNEKTAINVLLQIKIGDEETKSGASYELVREMAAVADAAENISLRGLMCIPPASDDFEQQKQYFNEAKLVYDQLASSYKEFDTLSMGMSGDLEAAIYCGSTIVRIGTDLFGRRI